MREQRQSPDRSSRRSSHGFHQAAPKDWLLMAVDVGLFAAIFILPFIMGGRQAIGEFALTLIACWTASVWLLRQSVRGDINWRLTGMAPLLLLGIGIGVLQFVPLSPEWLNQLSPRIASRLPAWFVETTQPILGGPWSTISLTPFESQRSLVCVIGCALLFIVAVNRIQTLQDVRRVVRGIAIAATLMALFGCLQYVCGNSKFFWVYDYPFTNTRDYAKGAFTNPNHFADYLAMALPLLLAWYAVHSLDNQSSFRPSSSDGSGWIGPLIIVCLSSVSIGILLSQSRGGLLAASGGVMACLFFLHRVRALNGRTAGAIGSIACIALLSLALFGDRITALVEANFNELVSADMGQLDRGDSRQKIWQAAIAGIRENPIMGTGLSSHREVYWSYYNYPDAGTEFSHAENGYLQLALETGFAGLAAAIGCVLVWLGWCLRGIRRAQSLEVGALLAAIVGVIAIHLAHSVTDFIWYAPGIMVTVVLLAACAAALHRLSAEATPERTPSRDAESPPSFRFQPVWGTAFVGVLLLSGWMLQVKYPAFAAEPHWFEYVRLVQEEDRLPDDADRAGHRRDKYLSLLNAARADRYDARIQLRVARAYQSMFELQQRSSDNPMSLLQIQDAALASDWGSHEELTDWLNRPGVLGTNRKYLDTAWDRAVHALSLCPLQAEGYLMLGELAWIYESQTDIEDELLSQALRARPYDAEVHYVVGRVLSLRGNEPAALEHWKQSFQRSPRFRQQITELLAPVWNAQRFIDVFEPDTDALVTVVTAYQSSPDVEGYQSIAAQLAQQLCEQATQRRYTEAVQTWRQAHEIYLQLGDKTGADQTARAAAAADPSNFQARRCLAKWLFSQQDYAAAVEHLQWCKRRSPNDREVEGWLHAAISRQSQPQLASPDVSDQRRI